MEGASVPACRPDHGNWIDVSFNWYGGTASDAGKKRQWQKYSDEKIYEYEDAQSSGVGES